MIHKSEERKDKWFEYIERQVSQIATTVHGSKKGDGNLPLQVMSNPKGEVNVGT